MLTVNIKLNCTRNTIGSGTILSGEHDLYVLGKVSIYSVKFTVIMTTV